MTMRATAIIIGRAGSKGLPGKNALHLLDRPIITYSIDHARHAACVDHIIVSTDGAAIADAARDANVDVVHRPARLATDDATVAAVVRHVLEVRTISTPALIVLYANVPIRPDDLIDRAVERLSTSGADSVQSYTRMTKHHPYWMMRMDDHGSVTPFIDNTIDRRQDLPALWLPDGGVIAVRRDVVERAALDQPHDFLGRDRRGVETRAGEVVDIDEPIDLAMAEALLRHRAAMEMPA